MKRKILLKFSAPLAVAALALSACGGAQPGGIGGGGVEGAAPPSVSAPPVATAPGVPSPPPSLTVTNSVTAPSDYPMPSQPASATPVDPGVSSAVPVVPSQAPSGNDAAVDSVGQAFATNNPGFQFKSAAVVAASSRASEARNRATVFSPATCGSELSVDRQMSPDKGFSVSNAVNSTAGSQGVTFFQVNDPATLTALKATLDRASTECATYQITSGSRSASVVETPLVVSVPGADASWGTKTTVTTAGKSASRTTVFAFKGNRGVSGAVATETVTPSEVQALAARALQSWGATG